MPLDLPILGEGVYSPREAARLAGTNSQSVLRWTRGSGPREPLWRAYYSQLDDATELSFLDLTEIRVVVAMRRAGVSLQAIRFAVRYAEQAFGIDRPLATQRFKTDGKEILIQAFEGDSELTSLSPKRAGQRVFKEIVQQTLRDLEYDGDRPTRWRPRQSPSVVIDPARSFGDPLLDDCGVSTRAILAEFQMFGDVRYLSRIYEIPESEVKSALQFERSLDGQGSV